MQSSPSPPDKNDSAQPGRYIGIDPGHIKCGYAVVSSQGQRLALEIVPTQRLTDRLACDMTCANVTAICVGNATRSDEIVRMILERWPEAPVSLVNEYNTSLEARRRYYEDHPPRGLLRFVPRGLLVPKAQLDGYAALLIIERFRNAARGLAVPS